MIHFEQEGDRTFWEQFESEVSEFKSKTAGMEESKVTKNNRKMLGHLLFGRC